jgi:hypothetical protein
MALTLPAYQSIVTDPNDIPVEQLRGLFLELLRQLNLQLVQEATPDYCVYEITKVTP